MKTAVNKRVFENMKNIRKSVVKNVLYYFFKTRIKISNTIFVADFKPSVFVCTFSCVAFILSTLKNPCPNILLVLTPSLEFLVLCLEWQFALC